MTCPHPSPSPDTYGIAALSPDHSDRDAGAHTDSRYPYSFVSKRRGDKKICLIPRRVLGCLTFAQSRGVNSLQKAASPCKPASLDLRLVAARFVGALSDYGDNSHKHKAAPKQGLELTAFSLASATDIRQHLTAPMMLALQGSTPDNGTYCISRQMLLGGQSGRRGDQSPVGILLTLSVPSVHNRHGCWLQVL